MSEDDLKAAVARLAQWLLEADIGESLDVIGILAEGDIEGATRRIEGTC